MIFWLGVWEFSSTIHWTLCVFARASLLTSLDSLFLYLCICVCVFARAGLLTSLDSLFLYLCICLFIFVFVYFPELACSPVLTAWKPFSLSSSLFSPLCSSEREILSLWTVINYVIINVSNVISNIMSIIIIIIIRMTWKMESSFSGTGTT